MKYTLKQIETEEEFIQVFRTKPQIFNVARSITK